MFELSSHPFSSENVFAESGANTLKEQRWLSWCDKVENILGHDLDGNDPGFQHGVGYSLDEAYVQWSSGMSPQSYCELVTARSRYRKPA
jgi:hypothetical protein